MPITYITFDKEAWEPITDPMCIFKTANKPMRNERTTTCKHSRIVSWRAARQILELVELPAAEYKKEAA